MGYKWEVHAFVKTDSGFLYMEVYEGKSLIGAIKAARAAKKAGSGCIRIEWRP